MHTPYTPDMPYTHPLRAPLTCLMCTPYMHPLCALCAPLTHLMCTPYVPYMHCLQESDWLMSPPHPIRSMELNNLINIKSWYFPHHLMCLMHHMHLTRLTCLMHLTCHMHLTCLMCLTCLTHLMHLTCLTHLMCHMRTACRNLIG